MFTQQTLQEVQQIWKLLWPKEACLQSVTSQTRSSYTDGSYSQVHYIKKGNEGTCPTASGLEIWCGFIFKCSPSQNFLGLWFDFCVSFFFFEQNVKKCKIHLQNPAWLTAVSLAFGAPLRNNNFIKRGEKNKKHGNSSYFFHFYCTKNFKEFVFIILIKTGWVLGDLGRGNGMVNMMEKRCMCVWNSHRINKKLY